MDEAIVLLWYLSREVWNRGSSRLEGTFDHPAERHGVRALLQELAARLIKTARNACGTLSLRRGESHAPTFRRRYVRWLIPCGGASLTQAPAVATPHLLASPGRASV